MEIVELSGVKLQGSEQYPIFYNIIFMIWKKW